MASSAATLKILSLLNLNLSSTLALSTCPSLSNDTIMSTMRVSLPAAPIGGSQHLDKCARNRSISESPSGPMTGFSGAFKTSPAAALKLLFSLSAAILRSCSRRFFPHLRSPPWPWPDSASPLSARQSVFWPTHFSGPVC